MQQADKDSAVYAAVNDWAAVPVGSGTDIQPEPDPDDASPEGLVLRGRWLEGIGDPGSLRDACACYRRAAELGSAEGCYRLGVMYEFGRGCPQSFTEAAA